MDIDFEPASAIRSIYDADLVTRIKYSLKDLAMKRYISFEIKYKREVDCDLEDRLKKAGYSTKLYISEYRKLDKQHCCNIMYQQHCCNILYQPVHSFAVALNDCNLPDDMAKPQDIKKTGAGFNKNFAVIVEELDCRSECRSN